MYKYTLGIEKPSGYQQSPPLLSGMAGPSEPLVQPVLPPAIPPTTFTIGDKVPVVVCLHLFTFVY
jgi:hypothetical protein